MTWNYGAQYNSMVGTVTYTAVKQPEENSTLTASSTAASEEEQTLDIDTKTTLHSFALLTQYWLSPSLGLNTNINYSFFDSNVRAINRANELVGLFGRHADISAELMQTITSRFFMTAGISRQYDFILDPGDVTNYSFVPVYGYGVGATWLRPNKTFSSPTLGVHYLSEKNRTAFAFNTDFN